MRFSGKKNFLNDILFFVLMKTWDVEGSNYSVKKKFRLGIFNSLQRAKHWM